ncbi:MAG: hypothetical protein GYB66_06930 [Chloroflexi bacterium]|nr:hypothetical protein [Chloroflexota bacterium]
MSFGEDPHDLELARRFRHRSILLFIILATLPCYIVGGILLGVAPDDDDVSGNAPTDLPPPGQRTDIAITITGTVTSTATGTLQASDTPGALRSTPRQFVPSTATPFPTQRLPTSTDAPTATTRPTATTEDPPENRAPVFDSAPGDRTLRVGEVGTVTLQFTDPDGDPVSFTASSDAPAIAEVSAFGESAFDVTAVAAGSATITVTLEDDQGGVTSAQFLVTVEASNPVNNPPVFESEPTDLTVNVGQSTTVTISTSDPDDDPVSLAVSSANPAVATATRIDDTSFSVQGIAAGGTTVTINLSDGQGGTASRTINVTVNAGPPPNRNPVFVVEPLPIIIPEGDSDIILLEINDPDGDPVTMTVTSANPGIATTTKIDNTSFTVQGVAVGETTTTIRLNDGRGGITTEVVPITVQAPAANNPPQFTTPPGDLSVATGATTTVTLNFSDPDGDPVSFSLTVGNTGIATATKTGDSTFTVTGVSTGSTTVTITLNDGQGGTANATITVTVT